jgi:hypothetical protein
MAVAVKGNGVGAMADESGQSDYGDKAAPCGAREANDCLDMVA